MKKRKKLGYKKSKKMFSRTARKVHKRNTTRPFRGGIRA